MNRSGVAHPGRGVTPSHDHGEDDNDETMARRLQEAEDEREAREVARRLEEAEGESQMRVSQATWPLIAISGHKWPLIVFMTIAILRTLGPHHSMGSNKSLG